MSTFSNYISDYSRKELETYCRYIEALEALVEEQDSLIEEQGSVIKHINELMQRLSDITETDPGEGSVETLRWRVKVLKRRNEVLKEENSELRARAESAEEEARAVALEEVLKLIHALQMLQQCRRKLTWDRNRRTEEVEEPKRSDAEQFAEAVAVAWDTGKRWDSGAHLLRWIRTHLSLPHSTSTIKRRFQDAGLWVASGKRGKASVKGTVERCIAFHKDNSTTDSE